MTIECLGILCNIGTIPNFDFTKCIKSYQIMPFLISTLSKSSESTSLNENDDLLLEVIVLIGNMLNDPSVIPILLDSGIPKLIVNLLFCKLLKL